MQTYINTQYCNSGSKKNRYGVRLTVIQNSQDIANNRSNVTITFELGGAGALGLTTDYTGSSMNGFTYYGNIYINGTSVATGSHTGNMNNSTVATIATWTDNINHNPDGTLSINVRGVFTGGTSSQANGGEASGTVYFDTIPRASSVACTTANIGAKPTITITSATSSFTHKLYYSFGSIPKTLITDTGLTGNTTITYNNWTIPATFYPVIPNSQSGQGAIYCETYSSGTLIGEIICPLNVTVPSTAKPNISNPTIVDTDTVSKNTIKLYVIGKSKLKFTFPAFSTNYSSTLQSYTLNINGTQVYSGTDSTYTMSTALAKASNTYELIITDSRGISNTTGSKSLSTAYAYSEPKITLFTVERNSEIPTTVNIHYSGVITNVNNNNRNTKSFKIEFKQTTASSWTTITTATDAYTKTNVAVNQTSVSDSNSFDFRITAVDSYNLPVTASVQIGTSETLMNFNAEYNTMAFGKASESSTDIEFAIPTDFQKPARFNEGIQGKELVTSGTGYVNCFSLSTTGTYISQAITFDVIQVGRSAKARIILANNGTAGNLTLTSFFKEGNSNLYYIVSNNVMTVYIQKSGSADIIEIANLEKGKASAVKLTWNNTLVSSLPSGYGTASVRASSFGYGITNSATNNSSGNLITSQAVQNAIAHIIPYSLYDNSTGTTGNVTLSDSAANYAYLEIFYEKDSSGSVKVANPNGKTVSLSLNNYYNTINIYQLVEKSITISGTSITVNTNQCAYVNFLINSYPVLEPENSIKIIKVIGYK